jgi:hypothetical protein
MIKMSDEPKEPFEAPAIKTRKKRDKVKKARIHIYISNDCINQVDAKGAEFGLDRSPCIQMLINFALLNMKTSNFGQYSTQKQM